MGRPVVLSYGMGRDSTAILFRWMLEPASRNFDLGDLTVVTAQVGNEWPDTYRLVEKHMLPLMRQHGVRWVQVARKGPELVDGVTVLSDSTASAAVRSDAPWTLRDELAGNGTVPESAAGRRKCSIKYKGEVLDQFVGAMLSGEYKPGDAFVPRSTKRPETPHLHILGFNADEVRRVTRDQCYGGGGRDATYPLVEWGWGHEKVAAYCHEVAGEAWSKSACHFCPFSRGQEEVRKRAAEFPELGADVLWLEHVALALNDNMKLYASRSAREAFNADPVLDKVEKGFLERIDAGEWSIYHLRRVMVDGTWDRAVEAEFTGDRTSGRALLNRLAMVLDCPVTVDAHGIAKVVVRDRQGDKKKLAAGMKAAKARRLKGGKGDPLVAVAEEFYVLAPAGVSTKMRDRFPGQWRTALSVLS